MNPDKEKKLIRPTKKQRETLVFIEEFIAEHGYSPSYREIMRACNYTSVATVALHVNNLIQRGHLMKRDHRARSLEVVSPGDSIKKISTNKISASEEKWLVEKIDHVFSEAEHAANPDEHIDKLHVLIGALRVLGLEGAAQSFITRLSDLKQTKQSS